MRSPSEINTVSLTVLTQLYCQPAVYQQHAQFESVCCAIDSLMV